ncbi:MAG: hypothetical protein GXP31_05345 [Kiritimatiellaeota bacterium]|nr:hypothetical protein [Kiritimatiellota bacterium]
MTGREIRLGKLFGDTGRAVVVACDHGMFDGPHAGMVDIEAMLRGLGDGPDAILLSPGMLAHTGNYFGRRGAPLAIARLNFNSVFCFHWRYNASVISHLFRPEDALALGADAVLVCLTLKTGSEATDARNAEIFVELCTAAHDLGLPVVAEYFPHSHLTKPPEELHEEIRIGCRMVAEFGADCIKTFYTCRFDEVTSSCPIPILGLGAEKTPTDLDALELAEREIQAGARGVVFGRNAIQSSDPPAFVAALQDIVKHEIDAREAASRHGLTQ